MKILSNIKRRIQISYLVLMTQIPYSKIEFARWNSIQIVINLMIWDVILRLIPG